MIFIVFNQIYSFQFVCWEKPNNRNDALITSARLFLSNFKKGGKKNLKALFC